MPIWRNAARRRVGRRAGTAGSEGAGDVLAQAAEAVARLERDAALATDSMRASRDALARAETPEGSSEALAVEVSGAILVRLEAFTKEATSLSLLLHRAAEQLGKTSSEDSAAPPQAAPEDGAEPAAAATADDDDSEQTVTQPPPRSASVRPASEGIRLLATQMAVAGSSFDEIESRLRRDFGIEDAGEILGDVLGPRAVVGGR